MEPTKENKGQFETRHGARTVREGTERISYGLQADQKEFTSFDSTQRRTQFLFLYNVLVAYELFC